jgi:DNA-binding NtrC family response regulator
MTRVLVVDDEPALRQALQASFERHGWQMETAEGTTEALERFRCAPFSLVVTDMRMPDGDGLKVMRGIRIMSPNTAVIFLTAHASVPEAVEAMKGGACDYLVKPVTFERLQDAARRVLRESLQATRPEPSTSPGGMVGSSLVMQRLMDRARQIAKTDVDVLLEAESGTGKELMARFIHQSSARRNGPFVAMNCAAVPEALLESELFGFVKGAFTGAAAQRAGKFEIANTGTLLLDEVSEMPLEQQPKLLRVLQQREVDRIGDRRPVGVDVRVVATTNRNLAALVAEGRFRADLYYRLNVISLNLPPLRERPEDIVRLTDHFLAKYSQGQPVRFSSELLDRLRSYRWPGNVRELENIVRRILALNTEPEAGPELLEGTGLAAASANLVEQRPAGSLRDIERQTYLNALQSANGNRTHAAELLGVSVRTIRNKVREFGFPPRRYA